MFSATAVGAAAASLTSGWTDRVHRHGLAIALAAACWGIAFIGFGLAPNLGSALGFLILAGAADMVSGAFRDTLWNQTIPDSMRGRLAGIEVVSYGLGPAVGQVRSGVMAAATSTRTALWAGGLMCVVAVVMLCALLPGFRNYDSKSAGTS